MRKIVCFVLLALSAGQFTLAADTSPAAPRSGGISLAHLIERVAERQKKNFIVDPRVAGEATLVGIDPERITYRELQAVLSVHGYFTTPEQNGVIEILPDANARQTPMPLVGDRAANIGDDEYVTRVLDAGPLQATQLVPLLRPMMPQQAHMVANAATNTLILVSRYDNVKQIEAIVRELQKRPAVPTPAATSTDK